MLGMSGAMPLLPYTFAWRAQGYSELNEGCEEVRTAGKQEGGRIHD